MMMFFRIAAGLVQQLAGHTFALMLLNDRQQIDLPALGIERQKTDDLAAVILRRKDFPLRPGFIRHDFRNVPAARLDAGLPRNAQHSPAGIEELLNLLPLTGRVMTDFHDLPLLAVISILS